MSLLTIEQIHKQKSGKISDKWGSYLTFYDETFEKYRTKQLSLLEIGVQNGGSLETWSTFFTNALVLVGCDIDPRCADLQYEDSRIKIVVGDANQPNTINQISAISNTFDIVIDDGSHQSNDIITSFLIYFSALKPGGIYIVEDTHTLYQNPYGGGILNELSAYSFFKKTIDAISYQFWNSELSLDVYFRGFFQLGQLPSFIKEGWIESIEFKNSIIAIKKSLKPSIDKLGSREVSGSVAQVNDAVLKLR